MKLIDDLVVEILKGAGNGNGLVTYVGSLLCGMDAFLQNGHDLFRTVVKDLTLGCQPDTGMAPFKQGKAQLRFQPSDRAAEGGLRDKQHICSLGNTADLYSSQKILKLLDLHGKYLLRFAFIAADASGSTNRY